jgi:hypothetical protein
MRKNRIFAMVFIGLIFLVSGCATVNSEWKKTRELDTVSGYESFASRYPKSSYANQARDQIVAKKWEGVKALDTIRAYEDFIMEYPKSSFVSGARERLKVLYNLDPREIKNITNLQKAKDSRVDQPDLVSRLLMAGANCLDDNAQWINLEQGRAIYQMLKNYDGRTLTDSMRRVIVVSINRLHVLFLVVKLGVNGSEQALNELLLDYGNKSMAEDYLNSGSIGLHDGGAAWARRNGYRIQSGPGSHRVRWGSF